jgi:hypothetical protein
VRSKKQLLLVLLVLFITAVSASGQLNGDNLKGDTGLKSGSQPPPGIYLTNLSYFYDSSEIKLPRGRSIDLTGGLNIYFNVTVASYVSKKKFLGAYYGAQLAVPVANTQLELPRLRSSGGGFGLSDVYVMPLYLGWHKKQADYTASYAFYAPTGRYTPGGNDNTGLGMWSHELAAGTTVYLDKKKSWNLATTAAYEIHQNKRGGDIKVGDLLTLEGGLGKTMLKGGLNLGAVYYAQWKVTADSGADLSPLLRRFGVDNAKNRAFALGGEASLVVPKLEGQFNVRALKEFGNRTATQGHAVIASFTFFANRPFRAMKKQPPEPATPPAEPAKQP